MTQQFFYKKYLVFFCLFVLTGCAAFSKNNPTLYTYNQIQQNITNALPGVDFTAKYYHQNSGTERASLGFSGHFNSKNNLTPKISHTLSKSKLFSNVIEGEGKYPIHFDFSLETHNKVGYLFTALPSGLTLLIFPAINKDEYTLSVKVYNNYNLIKKYEYSDFITQYMSIWVLPFSFSKTYSSVNSKVIEQLLLNFLHDFQKDLIIPRKIEINNLN